MFDAQGLETAEHFFVFIGVIGAKRRRHQNRDFLTGFEIFEKCIRIIAILSGSVLANIKARAASYTTRRIDIDDPGCGR